MPASLLRWVHPTSNPSAALPAALAPAGVLQDGEIIILAIKPSGWFVVLISLPVIASAAVVTTVAYGLSVYHQAVPMNMVYMVSALVTAARLLAGIWQWLGRTYVLTNRRIMTLRGPFGPRILQAQLPEVRRAVMAATAPERLTGTGSIYCFIQAEGGLAWHIVARPQETHEIVLQAINQARSHPRAG